MTADRTGLSAIAEDCIALVRLEFGVTLDGQVGSLEALDEVCVALRAQGPLVAQRRDLWWQLIGAYVGEVVVRTYDGAWIEHELAPGAFAVSVRGITAFPFATTTRVLEGEPFKSLASFARAIPAIADQRDP